jgi:hypothetical protein
MLVATSGVQLLDYFRVPYVDDGRGQLQALGADAFGERVTIAGQRGSLNWLRASDRTTANYTSGAYQLGTTPIFGRVIVDADSRPLLRTLGEGWERLAAVSNSDGARVASVWSDREGNVFLPFDPDELIQNFLSERYRAFAQTRARSTFEAVANPLYYRVKGLVPAAVRLRLRRVYGGISPPVFPRWPTEAALHDFYVFLFGLIQELAGDPLPMISLWPAGHSWSVVLTHDVERATGYAAMELLRSVERDAGYVSSWNFVPLRDYTVQPTVLDWLRSDGCEIGVHGLHHDGRDVHAAHLPKRLPRMRQFADEWGAVGFRSPSLLRDFDVMPTLGFDYDSSYPDTDPLQAQAGGCCSWLPFHNQDLVELPITLPQDHNLFELLGETDETLWREKATFLRARGGMALVLTHPDYMLERERRGAYGRLLAHFAADDSAWKALPREVSNWWRRRASSTLVRRNGAWAVEGPAAGDASVVFSCDAFGHVAPATDS